MCGVRLATCILPPALGCIVARAENAGMMDDGWIPHGASAVLKTLKALASAEQQQCNVRRGAFEAATDRLHTASRALRNARVAKGLSS